MFAAKSFVIGHVKMTFVSSDAVTVSLSHLSVVNMTNDVAVFCAYT
jgi:hypothetical protein